MNLAYAYWFSITAFGLIVLCEHGYAVWTRGLTLPTGLGLIAGVLIVSPTIWQAVDPEKEIDETDTGWWMDGMIVGVVSYTAGIVINLL